MVTLTMTLVATVLVMVIAVVARGLDGPQPAGRRDHPAGPGRLPDDPAVRLPGAGAGAVLAQPVHRDRRRGGLRRRRSRSSWSPTASAASRRPPSRRPASSGITSLADDPQGAAADGARGARAGHQPGPALRAVDGGHRRPGRRRQPRLPRGLGLLARHQLFGKGLAAGIAITALGVMLDRIARYAAGRYGRADATLPSLRGAGQKKEARMARATSTPSCSGWSAVAAVAGAGAELPAAAATSRTTTRRRAARPAATSTSRSTRGPATSPTPTSSGDVAKSKLGCNGQATRT